MSEDIDISPDNLDSNLCFIQTSISHGETVADFIFLGSKITKDGDCMKSKDAYSLEGKL